MLEKEARFSLRYSIRTSILILAAVLAVWSCTRDTAGLKPFTSDGDPVVFDDDFGDGVLYQPFLCSKIDAVTVDSGERFEGTASMKVTVPNPGNPCVMQGLGWTGGEWTGGAMTTDLPRDLSGYDALTFMAKASKNVTLDRAGLGNDNTGNSLYEAWRNAIPLTTDWKRYVIPIPLPEKLTSEQGMFFLAEGPEGGSGFDIWFDDLKFERLGTILNPRPVLASDTLDTFVGALVNLQGTSVTFEVDGIDQTIDHLPGYFTYTSDDEDVAMPTDEGILVVGPGSATITAELGSVAAQGTVFFRAGLAPTTPAPTPTVPSADVISLFSNAPGYTDVPVETWAAFWQGSTTVVEDFNIGADDIKAYSKMNFAGVVLEDLIDATTMTHLHLDVWIPEGNLFKVKLVDFGSDGLPGGVIGRDSEAEICFTSGSSPPLANGVWVGLEIPLDDFMTEGLMERGHLAQMVLATVPNPADPCNDPEIPPFTETVFVDNVYFHK